jgi:hypothetical protein
MLLQDGITLDKMPMQFDKLPLGAKWRRKCNKLSRPLAAQSKGYILRYRPELNE